MFSLHFLRKHRILLTWLLSYLVILMLPLVITTLIYTQTAKVLEKQISKSNTIFLSRLQKEMDAVTQEVTRLCNQIAFDPKMNQLLDTSNLKEVDPYFLYQIVHNFRINTVLNKSITTFYVYFNHLDLVVSPLSSGTSSEFYDLYYSNTKLSYPEWMGLINGGANGEYRFMDYIDEGGQKTKTIAFIRTIPILYRGKNFASVVILLDEEQLMQGLKNIEVFEHSSIVIVDRDNQQLAVAGANEFSGKIDYKALSLEKGNGISYQKIDGKKVVISYTVSELSHWKSLIIIPVQVFWEEIDYIGKLTFLGLTACLLLGISLTYWALKKNYNPLHQLIKFLEKRQGETFDETCDEFAFIKNAIGKTYAELERVDAELKQQNDLLRTHLLNQLLSGEVSSENIQDRLAFYEIRFKSDYYAVLAFYINDYDEERLKPEGNLVGLKKAQALVSDTFIKRIGQENQGFMTEMGGTLICLFNFAPSQIDNWKDVVSEIALQTVGTLEKEYGIGMLVAISNLHASLENISVACHEAIRVMEQQKMLGMDDVIFYTDVLQLPKGDYYYPLELEQKLINMIRIGDLKGSIEIVEEVFARNFKEAVLPVEIGKCLIYNLVSTMMKTMSEINMVVRNDFLDDLNVIEKLLRQDSILEIQEGVIDVLTACCQYAKQWHEAQQKNRLKQEDIQLVKRVQQYVNENYRDINLSITTIAQHFEVNPVYLSRIFLEHTGESLLNYINKLRVDKAKQLFRQMNNLDEVALAVGYSNTRTFSRAFKKLEGVTPGKYKKVEVSSPFENLS